MIINRKIKTTFTKISKLYNRARIGYPQLLIEDIIKFSELKEGDRVLDAGCGTGQATILFAKKSFKILGLDLGKEMIDTAIKNHNESPDVSFMVGSFEETDLNDNSFNLIISAMAWHWIPEETRNQKARRILKKDGSLALIWSWQQKRSSQFVSEVSMILDRFGGMESGPAGSRVERIANNVKKELIQGKFFATIESKEYYEQIKFNKERYLDLVLSYGWVQNLSEKNRNSLVEELKKLFNRYQEPINIPYKHQLILAKKNKEKRRQNPSKSEVSQALLSPKTKFNKVNSPLNG